MQPETETTGSKIGGGIFGIALIFCSMEMVEGWGILGLDWPPRVFYGIMAVSGCVAGVLCGGRYIVPAVLGMVIGGVGALFAIAWVLERVNTMHSVVLVLVGIAGALPGAGVYFALKFLQDQVLPPKESAE
jgi:hypothetical protein